ncbi:MAG: sulfotransferase [Actinomycetota bacterium]
MAFLRPFRRWRQKWRSQREWSVRDSLWGELGAGLRGQLYLDRGGKPRDTTFVAGTARSGTSWISEVINHRNEYRIIHEPLRRERLRVTRVFRPRHYLRPDDRTPEYLRAMETILSGDIRSIWTDKYNRKLLPSKRLVREVRGNLLLPWIHGAFPEVAIVLVLRHPCAVVASQLRWGREWPVDLSRFLAEPALVEDVLAPFASEIASANSEFERHIFAWCIESYVPLHQLRPGEIQVVFYENLCTTPAAELERLLGFLDARPDGGALARLGRASSSTRKDSAIVTGGDLVSGWRAHVSDGELRRAVEILELFGLDRIYGDDPMPRPADPSAALSAGS